MAQMKIYGVIVEDKKMIAPILRREMTRIIGTFTDEVSASAVGDLAGQIITVADFEEIVRNAAQKVRGFRGKKK